MKASGFVQEADLSITRDERKSRPMGDAVKRSARLVFVFIFAGSLGLFAKMSFADDQWSKLGRGTANIALSPLEILYEPYYMWRDERFGIALFGGIFKGVAYMGKRIAIGAYEMATFHWPGKTNFEPIMEPEFVIPNG